MVGGYITGLSTVRALGRRGVPVAVVTTRADDVAPLSRWALESCPLMEFAGRPSSLLDLLRRRSAEWAGRVLMPDNDRALEVLSRHREALESHYRVVAPPWEITSCLLRKDLFHEAARRCGVETPRVYGRATREAAEAGRFDFPVIVKPMDSQPFADRFGPKLVVAKGRKELGEAVRGVVEAGVDALIMDLVPGPDDCVYNYSVYIDRRGEPLAEVAMRKLRKSPPFFGVCRVAELARAPQLREPTLELLRQIGWRGPANAEFKRDPRDGRFRLLEINGRSFMMQALAARAGIDYSALAWEEATGARPRPVVASMWDGVWIHLLDELYYGLFFRKMEGLDIARYLEPYRRPKAFAVWSARDPRPGIVYWARAARRAARLLLDRRARGAAASHVQPMPKEA